MRIVLIIMIVVLNACKGQKDATMDSVEDTVNNPLSLVIQDEYSGTEVPETLVIKNSKTLKSFFMKINRTRKPGLPIPEIDFSKEIVLIYCSGEQKDGSMPVLSVSNETDKEMIFMAKQERTTTKTTSITSPFSLYKMPLTEKEIIFDTAQK